MATTTSEELIKGLNLSICIDSATLVEDEALELINQFKEQWCRRAWKDGSRQGQLNSDKPVIGDYYATYPTNFEDWWRENNQLKNE